MKKRNQKWLKEKEYLQIKKELSKNYDTQRNLGWVELETPRFIGWKAKLQPRQDIQNREDAWIFWSICENLGTEVFARKIELFGWNRKKKSSYEQAPPTIKSISEGYYLGLNPQVRKYFKEDTFSKGSRWGTWYYCDIPNFFWEIIYEKEFKTKVKLIDEILLQEEAELEGILERDFYNYNNYYSGVPKEFRKHLNRKERAKLKRDLLLIREDKEPEYVPNYRSAAWLYW